MRIIKPIIFILLSIKSFSSFCQEKAVSLDCLQDTSNYFTSRYYYLTISRSGAIFQIDSIGKRMSDGLFILKELTKSPQGKKIGFVISDIKTYSDSIVILRKDSSIVKTLQLTGPLVGLNISDSSNFCILKDGLKFYHNNVINEVSKIDLGWERQGKYSNSGKLFVLLVYFGSDKDAVIYLFESSGNLLVKKNVLAIDSSFNFQRFDIVINEKKKTLEFKSVIPRYLSRNKYEYIQGLMRFKYTNSTLIQY